MYSSTASVAARREAPLKDRRRKRHVVRSFCSSIQYLPGEAKTRTLYATLLAG